MRGLTRFGTFGEALPDIENRVELASDKDEFGMPLGKIIHSYDQDAIALWNANFEEGLTIAGCHRRQGSMVGARNMPTIHLMGGTIMGTRGKLGGQQLRPDPRDPEPYMAAPAFATAGAFNPTYTIRASAARRRAAGGEMEYGRGC